MGREKVLQRSVWLRRDEEAEHGSCASENEDRNTIEQGTDDSKHSSADTETTVSEEDVSNSR
jgi:hypothetical protein